MKAFRIGLPGAMQCRATWLLIGLCQDSVAGKFAAVVADRHLRLAALDHRPVQKFVSSNVLRFLLDNFCRHSASEDAIVRAAL